MLIAAPHQQQCLRALFRAKLEPGYGMYRCEIAREAGLTMIQARRALRALVRKGEVEIVRGIVNEQTGLLAGSGWALTGNGMVAAWELEP